MKAALRSLLRRPGQAALVAGILALGLGANLAMLRLLDAVFLRPFPLAEPGRIVQVDVREREGAGQKPTAEMLALCQSAKGPMEAAALWQWREAVLAGVDEPRHLLGSHVSARFFEVFAAAPAMGRTLTGSDFEAAEEAAVISHGLWSSQFRSAPDILGRSMMLDGAAVTIVGVMPPGFRFPFPMFEYWRPLREHEQRNPKGEFQVSLSGKLKRGYALKQAEADLAALYTASAGKPGIVRLSRLTDQFTSGRGQAVAVLAAAVFLLLLIACANASNLMLARYSERRQEFRIRAALGATRRALFGHILGEGLLLAVAAAAGGLVLSEALERAFLARYWSAADLLEPGPWNAAMTGAAFGLVLLTALLCTLPAGWDLFKAKGGGANRLQSALLAAETGLSLVLLVGAALMMESFVRILAAPLGFHTQDVLTAQVAIPRGIEEAAARAAYYDRLLAEVQTVAGVREAAITTVLPLSGISATTTLSARGAVDPERGKQGIYMRSVTPQYFSVLGVPIRRGRAFLSSDGPEAGRVAIVNEAMARRVWPGEDPVGRFVSREEKPAANSKSWTQIVGVAANIRHTGITDDPKPEIYFPMSQDASFAQISTLILRHEGPAGSLMGPLRQQVRRFNPNQPVDQMKTMQAWVEERTVETRLHTSLLTLFSALALALTAAGVLSAGACFVRMRARELAIRSATGASAADLVRHVLRRTLTPVAAGALLGLGAAAGLSRLLRAQLFEVEPGDPRAWAAAAVLLMGATLCAALWASLGVTRVDPASTLRLDDRFR